METMEFRDPKSANARLVIAGEAGIGLRQIERKPESGDPNDVAGNANRAICAHYTEVYGIERYLYSTARRVFPRGYTLDPENPKRLQTAKFQQSKVPDIDLYGPSNYRPRGPVNGCPVDIYTVSEVDQPNLGAGVRVYRASTTKTYLPPSPTGHSLCAPPDDIKKEDDLVVSLGLGGAFRQQELTTEEGKLLKNITTARSVTMKLRWRDYLGQESTSESVSGDNTEVPTYSEQRAHFIRHVYNALRKRTGTTAIVVNANDLRRDGFGMSKGLSWERTSEDFIRKITTILSQPSKIESQSPSVYELLKHAQVIVCNFQSAGSILLTIKEGVIDEAHLLAAPTEIEGEFELNYPGKMRGAESIMASSLAYGLHFETDTPNVKNLVQMVKNGLRAIRFEYARGFTPLRQVCHLRTVLKKPQLRFPGLEKAFVLDHPFDTVGEILRDKIVVEDFKRLSSVLENVFWINEVQGDPDGKGRRALREVAFQVQQAWDACKAVAAMNLDMSFFSDSNPDTYNSSWSLLTRNQGLNILNSWESPEYALAKSILDGSFDLAKGEYLTSNINAGQEAVPIGRFDELLTFSRSEIEQFREARDEIREYVNRSGAKHAHNILVLGEAGGGKSFAIKNLLKSVNLPQLHSKPIEVNISSISSREELFAKFHQARNITISGKIPTIFFDEFDSARGSSALGWLQQFLGPMWDLAFVENSTYQLGKTILVFAGSTFKSIASFTQSVDYASNLRTARDIALQLNDINLRSIIAKSQNASPGDPQNDEIIQTNLTNLLKNQFAEDKRAEQIANMKGPDFKSRFTSSINIQGVNPPENQADNNDSLRYAYILKRALLLRALLWSNRSLRVGNGLRIDPNVRDAFLLSNVYTHGARSLEQIVLASTISDTSTLDMVALPSESTIRLHVSSQHGNSPDFVRIVRFGHASMEHNIQ